MKRASTSMSLFLGVWVAVLIAGYMASRASVFAAGGGDNCAACAYCMNTEIVWMSSVDGYAGSVDNGTNTPDLEAGFGLDEVGGNPMIYGTDSCLDGSYLNSQMLEMVFYKSATPCTYTPLPPLPGNYTCMDGQGLSHTGDTYQQRLCGD